MTQNVETHPTHEELRAALADAPIQPTQEDIADVRKDEPTDGGDYENDRSGNIGDYAPQGTGGSSGQGGMRVDGRNYGEIYDDCPITPLGVRGDFTYYLDVLGQLRAVKKHEAQAIQSLFGHQIPQLCYNFPLWENVAEKGETARFERKKQRFDQTGASMVMNIAASECGVFDPGNSVRGVGMWTDDDGGLICHLGDKVLINGEKRAPGRYGAQIYPAFSRIPHPDFSENAPDPTPEIFKTLETWNWTSPDVAPFVALGMISTMMLCGALDWRPVFWLLAPAGAGKSELQKLMKLLHGDDGLIQSTDTSKAGITSRLGQGSLPVAVDELEPGDERSSKEKDIINLARVAASGGEWSRGTADQTGVGGKVYSAFLFSSILIPGIMKTQDVQRLIRLELRPLDENAPKLNLQPRTWRARGARLKALLVRRWPTWGERLATWRSALETAGVMGRDADNWSTVLAMADMAMSDEIADADSMDNWAKKIAFVATAGRAEVNNDADAMLLHLMGQTYDIHRRGEQYTIAQWVMVAAGLPGAPESLMGNEDPIDAEAKRKNANAKLAKAGLRVYGKSLDAELFIANQPIQTLKDLFRFSDWANGVWSQSASRVPGAKASPNPATLAGIRTRGTLMPIKSIPGLAGGFPMDRDLDASPNPSQGASNAEDWA